MLLFSKNSQPMLQRCFMITACPTQVAQLPNARAVMRALLCDTVCRGGFWKHSSFGTYASLAVNIFWSSRDRSFPPSRVLYQCAWRVRNHHSTTTESNFELSGDDVLAQLWTTKCVPVCNCMTAFLQGRACDFSSHLAPHAKMKSVECIELEYLASELITRKCLNW